MRDEFLTLFCVFSVPLVALSIGGLVAVFLDADDYEFSDSFKDLPSVLSRDFYLNLFRLLGIRDLE